MKRSGSSELLARINAGMYEDAFGIEIGATRLDINRAHIRLLHQYRANPDARELLNKAKGLLLDEKPAARARRLLRLDHRDKAAEYLLNIICTSKDADEQHLLGYILLQLGRDGESRKYLERAVELRGSGSDYLWLGTALERLGKLDEALACYGKAVHFRGGAEEWKQLGNTLIRLERYDEALPVLDRAFCLMPTDRELSTKRRALRMRRFQRKVKEGLKRVVSFYMTKNRTKKLAAAGIGGGLLILALVYFFA